MALRIHFPVHGSSMHYILSVLIDKESWSSSSQTKFGWVDTKWILCTDFGILSCDCREGVRGERV
jgi:hypothetical protein